MTQMLGGDRPLAGGCRFVSASINVDRVTATFSCNPGGQAVVALEHPGAARPGSVHTTEFALSSTTASPDLLDALRASIASRERSWRWSALPQSPSQRSVGTTRVMTFLASPWIALLWLTVLAAMWAVAKDVLAESRRVIATGAVATLAAFMVRLLVPAGPANYFTDLSGSSRTVSPPWAQRGGGIFALYQGIDRVTHLSGTAILLLQRAWGALAVGAIVIAIGSTSERSPETAVHFAALIMAATLLAVDPLQARLSASDAMHVPAFLAFAIGALLYATLSKRSARSDWRVAILFFCAFLPGFTRIELALSPLVYPLLVGRWHGAKNGRTWWGPAGSHPILLAAIGASIAASSSVFHATSGTAVTAARIGSWFHSLGGALRSTQHDAWIAPVVLRLAVGGGLLALLRRRPRAMLVLLFLVVSHGVRAVSPLAAAGSTGALAYARHDIVHSALLLVLAAWSAKECLGLLRRVRASPVRVVACAGAILLCVFYRALQPLPYRAKYTYQYEYDFLARHVRALPRRCRMMAVWTPGEGDTNFEAGLALPHPLLSYDEPERAWQIVRGPDEIREQEPGCRVYFEASACQLDPEATAGSESGRLLVHAITTTCDRLAAQRATPIAVEDVPARPLQWPYRGPRVPLGLFFLGNE